MITQNKPGTRKKTVPVVNSTHLRYGKTSTFYTEEQHHIIIIEAGTVQKGSKLTASRRPRYETAYQSSIEKWLT